MNYPIKRFISGPLNNLILENEKEINSFLAQDIEKLIACSKDVGKLKLELERVFSEFVDVYDHDKKTAVIPEPSGTFSGSDEKQIWIEKHLLAIDFEYHLGRILYSYHDWLVKNAGLPDVILGRMITDYPSVYERVLYDYVGVLLGVKPQYPFQLCFKGFSAEAAGNREQLKNSMQRQQLYGVNKPYFASYALPSLIEHYLIGFEQEKVLDELIRELFRRNQSGGFTIDAGDIAFLKKILKREQYMDGSKEDSMKRCRDIFVSAGMVQNKDMEEILLGMRGRSPLTLNMFLKNSYAKTQIKQPYYEVLEMLFANSNVNLRNSIMHGASLLFDPFAVCFVAVMIQVFWSVIDRSIFTWAK